MIYILFEFYIKKIEINKTQSDKTKDENDINNNNCNNNRTSYNNFSKGDTGTLISKIINESPRLMHLNLTACHLGLKIKQINNSFSVKKNVQFN